MPQPPPTLRVAESGPGLPVFDRLAPPPPLDLLVAALESATRAGEIVADPHSRGGWVARVALSGLRRACSFESAALTRLLAEVVMRPPDLRHFDAAVASLALRPLGQAGLRQWIEALFASRCPTCGRAVIVDEFVWEVDATGPLRKTYRCATCRDQVGGGAGRIAPADAADAERARSVDGRAAFGSLWGRFPMPEGAGTADQILGLYTPRSLVALDTLLGRLEADRRAPPIDAALRLAFLHVLLPASRLNGYPGRVAALRINRGVVRPPGEHGWRERNTWLLFEEGCQLVRSFIGRLGSGGTPAHARFAADLADLGDGTGNVVLCTGGPGARENAGVLRPGGTRGGDRPWPRVALVVGQPPIRWSVENLSFAYLGTALAMGRAAAETLPLELLFGETAPDPWDRQAAELAASLDRLRSSLGSGAKVLLLLDPGGPEGLVAAALGGVGGGLRLVAAHLAEEGTAAGGKLEFAVPAAAGVRAVDGAAISPEGPVGSGRGSEQGPVEGAAHEVLPVDLVADVAVDVLQARGEPARFERLLSELLVGLDARGALAGPSEGSLPRVRTLLERVTTAFSGPEQARLEEVEPGRWWLRDPLAATAAQPPLADRVEWAVFSLLSMSDGIGERALSDRIAALFPGFDAPDGALIRACLESYGVPGPSGGLFIARDDLQTRHAEHAGLIRLLVEYGRRLGLSCWIGRREQGRRAGTIVLGDLLSEEERDARLRLFIDGDREALEAVDCIWYLRDRAAFLFEVEWTAMVGEAVLRRGPRIRSRDSMVRFLVLPPERIELLRFKLERSAPLRAALERDNWHIVKSYYLPQLAAQEGADLERFGPYLGLDPEIEQSGEQLPLFA